MLGFIKRVCIDGFFIKISVYKWIINYKYGLQIRIICKNANQNSGQLIAASIYNFDDDLLSILLIICYLFCWWLYCWWFLF